MAKNSLPSVVRAINSAQLFKIEGSVVDQTPVSITVQYRESGKRRNSLEIMRRSDVAVIGPDYLWVKRPGKSFTKAITGTASVDKTTGWIEVDGISYSPEYASVVADLGVPEDSKPKKAKTAKKKSK